MKVKKVKKLSTTIEHLSTDYGRHQAAAIIPNVYDGLKKVQRRSIWANVGLKKPTIMTSAGADALKLHPYSDQSTFETIARLGTRYKHILPLIEIDGNDGTYSGDAQAQARYLKITLSPFCKDIFLNGIDTKTFKTILAESMDQKEPKYFIPKIPTALTMASKGVAFGVSSNIVPYDLYGVCELTKEFIVKKTKGTHITNDRVANHLIPVFPIPLVLRNLPNLQEEYSKGNYRCPIVTDGLMDITKHTITIKTVSPDIEFKSVTNKIYNTWKDKNSWLHHNLIKINDNSDSRYEASFKLIFKRNIDIFEALTIVKSMVEYTGTTKPIMKYSIDGIVARYTPITILERWFKERVRSKTSQKKFQQIQLTTELNKLKTIIIVYDHLDEVINIMRGTEEEEGMSKLMKNYQLTRYQCELIYSGLNLGVISRTSKTKYTKQLEEVKEKLKTISESFTNIPKEMVDEITSLQNKYGKEPKDATISYLGYVNIDTSGIVQFQTMGELFTILKNFNGLDKKIHMYDLNTDQYNLSIDIPNQYGCMPKAMLPKAFKGTTIVDNKEGIKYSLLIRAGKAHYIEGYVNAPEDYTVTYLKNSKIICVNKNGIVTPTTLEKEFVLRKTLSVGNMTDVLFVLPDTSKTKLVFVCNTNNKNKIYIKYINSSTSGISLPLTGNNKVIHVVEDIDNLPEEFCVNIPKEYTKKVIIKHLLISKKSILDIIHGAHKIKLPGILDISRKKIGKNVLKVVKRYPQMLKIT